ncbi:alpha-ketoglutarate-dependent dioxygenase AlkB [Nocardiopsis dassonvillei]|jgi:alkylated DNA repair protein (DNA oxidative demethylase)|uniref:alpha-ketoglutarate-dependent dioxygenase AlkB family protein n=1 Tax=Nocardiopsis dassonvillei TaxID=2014 RepID=UPI0020A2FBCF|nr:alpha-ketoglutarate-dependent dioxygenase AlkB [Nocardiopsis dassonvillei]MCP3012871.1 alpha-ketoglutarate-dependent dioxygenase AlkB [Nocardiopsis dassonvillei]
MSDALFDRPPAQVAPGAVHVPGWLDPEEQADLVRRCRDWARGPAGMRRHAMPRGGVMSVRTVSLGWHWSPGPNPHAERRGARGPGPSRHRQAYSYARLLPDGTPVQPFPDPLGDLAARAVEAAYGAPPGPDADPYDVALVNFYDADARMGMHQDRDELSGAPVVSLSLGDTCVFRFGNTETRNRPHTDVELRSGDLFVFGGPSRMAYHGVPRTRPGTAPPALGLDGRLNITVRASGLRG